MWLHEILSEKVENERTRLQQIKKEYSDVSVGEIKVRHLFNGLRGAAR